MATSYPGNATATESPSPQPALNAVPIRSLPADTDGGTWANAYQAIKDSANWETFIISQLLVNALTGRRFSDDFIGPAPATSVGGAFWNVATTGTASATYFDDAANDGAGVCVMAVATTASSLVVSSQQAIPIGTRDFFMHIRARHFGAGTHYNFLLGLSSPTSANQRMINVTSGGSGAMTLSLGSSSVTITGVTFGATYLDFIFSRVNGVLTFTVGSFTYSVADTTNLSDVSLDLENRAGDSDAFYVDKITLLVRQ